MQVKKRKTTKRRHRRLSEMGDPGRRRKRTTRRRRSHRSKGILSEMISAPAATSAGKAIVSGIVGGFLVNQIVKLIMPDQKPLTKGLLIAGLSFITGTVLKMPNVAAGMAGVGILTAVQPATLSENFLSQDELDMLPPVLSENYLSAAGSPSSYLESLNY